MKLGKFKTAMLAGAAIGILSLASTAANATVVAWSEINITNFKVQLSTDGGTTWGDLNLSQVDVTGGSSTGEVSADLTAVPLVAGESGTDAYACQGVCAHSPDNAFVDYNSLPGPVGNAAIGDNQLAGSVLAVGAAPAGASATTYSAVLLSGEDDGSANSEESLTSAVTFTALVGGFLRLSYDYDGGSFAGFDIGAGPGTDANAASDWFTTLKNLSAGTDCVTKAASQISTSAAVVDGNPASDTLASTHVDSTTCAVATGDNLSLVIQHTSSADAILVPEPLSLTLLGSGLLGLGFLRRRKAIA
jgi:hypothetical protein